MAAQAVVLAEISFFFLFKFLSLPPVCVCVSIHKSVYMLGWRDGSED